MLSVGVQAPRMFKPLDVQGLTREVAVYIIMTGTITRGYGRNETFYEYCLAHTFDAPYQRINAEITAFS